MFQLTELLVSWIRGKLVVIGTIVWIYIKELEFKFCKDPKGYCRSLHY